MTPTRTHNLIHDKNFTALAWLTSWVIRSYLQLFYASHSQTEGIIIMSSDEPFIDYLSWSEYFWTNGNKICSVVCFNMYVSHVSPIILCVSSLSITDDIDLYIKHDRHAEKFQCKSDNLGWYFYCLSTWRGFGLSVTTRKLRTLLSNKWICLVE